MRSFNTWLRWQRIRFINGERNLFASIDRFGILVGTASIVIWIYMKLVVWA